MEKKIIKKKLRKKTIDELTVTDAAVLYLFVFPILKGFVDGVANSLLPSINRFFDGLKDQREN